ncbi:hypothetical protein KAU11_00645 [Candidatus Babeliales bacterium]|nr:hypothetical protein [Candidatus Babeliales bacterium]
MIFKTTSIIVLIFSISFSGNAMSNEIFNLNKIEESKTQQAKIFASEILTHSKEKVANQIKVLKARYFEIYTDLCEDEKLSPNYVLFFISKNMFKPEDLTTDLNKTIWEYIEFSIKFIKECGIEETIPFLCKEKLHHNFLDNNKNNQHTCYEFKNEEYCWQKIIKPKLYFHKNAAYLMAAIGWTIKLLSKINDKRILLIKNMNKSKHRRCSSFPETNPFRQHLSQPRSPY